MIKNKLTMIYIVYLDLSPGLKNKFSLETHKVLIESLRNFLEGDNNFSKTYPSYNLIFTISTKVDVLSIEVKGPTITKKSKDVNYSIFLPNENYNLQGYLDYVFDGISIALSKYDITQDEILKIRDECKRKLSI